jgi:hypothetical protein
MTAAPQPFKNNSTSRSARRLTGDFTDSLPLAFGATALVKAPTDEMLKPPKSERRRRVCV